MSHVPEPDETPPFGYCAVIPHAAEPQVLLLPGEGGWRLPQWQRSDEDWASVGQANQAIAEQLGLRVTTCRCVRAGGGAAAGSNRRVYAYWMENHSPEWAPPPGARWLERAELDGLALAIPDQRRLLEEWFADREGGRATPHRAPWVEHGWFDTAAAWVAARAEEQGITLTGPIEQHRSLTISCLLRVETTSGRLYLKTSPPEMFPAEAALTQRLAERYPGSVPSLVATDALRSWMLMREFGGVPLWQVPQIARWEEVVRVYTRMQIEFAEGAESLLSLGCRDRRVDRVVAGIDSLLIDVAASQRLSEAELQTLHTLVPRIEAMGEELAEYRVPATLEHGDLHPGNVAVRDDVCILYDWSDGCLSHPFFSMVTLLDNTDGITDCPNAKERLRDLYLEAWTAFEPMDRLRRAYDLSQLLGYLHQAQSYQWIGTHLEQGGRWEWHWGTPTWLQELLKRMPESG